VPYISRGVLVSANRTLDSVVLTPTLKRKQQSRILFEWTWSLNFHISDISREKEGRTVINVWHLPILINLIQCGLCIQNLCLFVFYLFLNLPTVDVESYCCTWSQSQTHGRNLLEEESALRRDLYLSAQNTHNVYTSMTAAGFEPAIPTSEHRRITPYTARSPQSAYS
jgi:hypothetical protein